jgi:hypothetical protein
VLIVVGRRVAEVHCISVFPLFHESVGIHQPFEVVKPINFVIVLKFLNLLNRLASVGFIVKLKLYTEIPFP